MLGMNRKTAPRVVGGRSLRKNRHFETRGLIDPTRRYPAIARERPGRGYRHVISQAQLRAFIDIVPDWDELAAGLNAVVLAAGDDRLDGRIARGIIYLCAWETDLHRDLARWYVDEHAEILEMLGVPSEPLEGGRVMCRFDEASARAFQLVHVLLHELGHHHDRMTTRSRRQSARGEQYAENFARERERAVWERYVRELA